MGSPLLQFYKYKPDDYLRAYDQALAMARKQKSAGGLENFTDICYEMLRMVTEYPALLSLVRKVAYESTDERLRSAAGDALAAAKQRASDTNRKPITWNDILKGDDDEE